MYEGKIVPAVVDSTADGGSLRGPEWAELVSRLAVADEMRRLAAPIHGRHTGNFERFGALGESAPAAREPIVNPDDLARGKGGGGIVPCDENAARAGDREMQ